MGLCIWEETTGASAGAGGSCAWAALPKSGFRFDVGTSTTPGRPAYSQVDGTVTPKAIRVEVRLSDGRVLVGKAYAPPPFARFTAPVRFFFIPVAGRPIPGEVLAFDSSGNVVAHEVIPRPAQP